MGSWFSTEDGPGKLGECGGRGFPQQQPLACGRWQPIPACPPLELAPQPPSPTHLLPACSAAQVAVRTHDGRPERRPREPCWTAPGGRGALNSARGGVGAGSGGRAAGAVPSGEGREMQAP